MTLGQQGTVSWWARWHPPVTDTSRSRGSSPALPGAGAMVTWDSMTGGLVSMSRYVSHHPTIGNIISKKYVFWWCETNPPKMDIYQPLNDDGIFSEFLMALNGDVFRWIVRVVISLCDWMVIFRMMNASQSYGTSFLLGCGECIDIVSMVSKTQNSWGGSTTLQADITPLGMWPDPGYPGFNRSRAYLGSNWKRTFGDLCRDM